MKKICSKCKGTGEYPTKPFWITAILPCLRCKGTGFLPAPKPTREELKNRLLGVVNGMTELERRMARETYRSGASIEQVADWITESAKLSSQIDKIWKLL